MRGESVEDRLAREGPLPVREAARIGRDLCHALAAVHDAGVLVNPMTLDGHITGGVAQGLGTAMYEQFAYDANGQPLSESFMDYLIPTAMDVPKIDIDHQETPSPFTEYGIKGGGEGGRMMAPPVIASAIEDALAPLGVTIRELPITEATILRLIREAHPRN